MKFGAEPARKAHKNLSEAGAAVSINYLEFLCSAPTCRRFRVDRAWIEPKLEQVGALQGLLD